MYYTTLCNKHDKMHKLFMKVWHNLLLSGTSYPNAAQATAMRQKFCRKQNDYNTALAGHSSTATIK